jgi:uncharacterized protein
MNMELRDLSEQVAPTLRRFGVVRAGVFGSVVRGEARPESDLDLLVEFEQGRTLFDLVELRDELSRVLGRRADVLTYGSLHPRLCDRVLRDEVAIL